MGPWWAAPSAALRAAAQHWATWAMQKQELARNLISQHDLLLRNQGRTAEDLIGRYLRGAKSEVTKAEKYEIKKGAFNTAADAIDYLRSRLTGIAGEGNKEIDDVLASKKPLPEQLAEIQAIQTRCNADAANASRDAVDKVMTAMQEILEAEDIGDDPRTWARANGFNVDDAPPPRLIRENDLAALTGPGARGGSFGSVEGAGDLASRCRLDEVCWSVPTATSRGFWWGIRRCPASSRAGSQDSAHGYFLPDHVAVRVQ